MDFAFDHWSDSWWWESVSWFDLSPFPSLYHRLCQLLLGLAALRPRQAGATLTSRARPLLGAYVVMLWLWGIIVNLLLIPNYFDIALRDFGLSLGALALARLSREFDPKPFGF